MVNLASTFYSFFGMQREFSPPPSGPRFKGHGSHFKTRDKLPLEIGSDQLVRFAKIFVHKKSDCGKQEILPRSDAATKCSKIWHAIYLYIRLRLEEKSCKYCFCTYFELFFCLNFLGSFPLVNKTFQKACDTICYIILSGIMYRPYPK